MAQEGRGGLEPGQGGKSQLRLYAIGVAVVLTVILIVQNSQKVEFNFFFASAETPLFFGLLIAFFLGAIVGWLLPRVRGGKNRGDDKK